jgi:flagellar motor switch protein FliM
MDVSQGSPARRPEPLSPLLRPPSLSADRLSHLHGVLEQVGVRCADGLRALFSSQVDVEFVDLAVGSADELITAWSEECVVGGFRSADPELSFLVAADGGFVSAALEAVFGADGSEAPRDRRRALSGFEKRLARGILERLAHASRDCLFGVDGAAPELDFLETADALPAAARQGGASAVAKFQLSTLERGGEFFVLAPQSALQETQSAPVAAQIRSHSRDPNWGRRIEQELQRTQVSLQAVLDECDLTLGEIADLQVGQILPLRATPRSQVKVVSNDQTVFWCELGQADGVYTVRIKDFADEEQELADAILSL